MDERAGQPDHLSYIRTYMRTPLQIQPTPHQINLCRQGQEGGRRVVDGCNSVVVEWQSHSNTLTKSMYTATYIMPAI